MPPEPARQRAAPPVATSTDLLGRVLAARARRLTPTQRADIVHVLANAERDHGLDPLLVLGVIEQESRFDPDAVGPHGSLGLMQVRPFVGEDVARQRKLSWRGPDTLFEPRDNVRIGIAYLGQMIDLYGDVDLALAAYNMGPGRLRALLDRRRQEVALRCAGLKGDCLVSHCRLSTSKRRHIGGRHVKPRRGVRLNNRTGTTANTAAGAARQRIEIVHLRLHQRVRRRRLAYASQRPAQRVGAADVARRAGLSDVHNVSLLVLA